MPMVSHGYQTEDGFGKRSSKFAGYDLRLKAPSAFSIIHSLHSLHLCSFVAEALSAAFCFRIAQAVSTEGPKPQTEFFSYGNGHSFRIPHRIIELLCACGLTAPGRASSMWTGRIAQLPAWKLLGEEPETK